MEIDSVVGLIGVNKKKRPELSGRFVNVQYRMAYRLAGRCILNGLRTADCS